MRYITEYLILLSVVFNILQIYFNLNLVKKVNELQEKLNQINKLSSKPMPKKPPDKTPKSKKGFFWKYYE